MSRLILSGRDLVARVRSLDFCAAHRVDKYVQRRTTHARQKVSRVTTFTPLKAAEAETLSDSLRSGRGAHRVNFQFTEVGVIIRPPLR